MILYIIINMSARGRGFVGGMSNFVAGRRVLFSAGGNSIGLGGGSIIRRSRGIGVLYVITAPSLPCIKT